MEDVLHQNKGVARKKDVQDVRSNIHQLQRTEGKGHRRMPSDLPQIGAGQRLQKDSLKGVELV